MTSVEIRPLERPARFLDLQRGFYRGDPHYVPPLTATEKWQVDRRKNPFFQHADAEFLAAWRDGQPVGRISAVRDRLHDEFHGDRVGFFGHFEATDEEAAHALLDAAADWNRRHDAAVLRGPVDLSTNYRCGLLVDGDPGPPVMMMPHNPPIYADWLSSFGLTKAKDLVALWGTQREMDRKRIKRVVDRVQRRTGAQVRSIRMARFRQELEGMWDLYQRIWERNWGFVPMSRDEFLRQAKDLKHIAVPDVILIVEIEGQPVGFAIGLPDVNVGTRACGGRLLPLGWLRFLRAMKRVDYIRVLTLGTLPEHRNAGLEMLMMWEIIERGLRNGIDAAEASWILEDNNNMIGPLESMGFRAYRRYRIYEKPWTST